MSEGKSLHGLVMLDQTDNVAVATSRLSRGDSVTVATYTVTPRTEIPPGHKVAVKAISQGEPIVKYGQPIGLTTADVQPGDHVHTHNLADHHIVSDDLSGVAPPDPPPALSRSFDGYHRPSGSVGTRNYVAVLSPVNCSASECHKVVERFDAVRMKRWPNVD